jgi:hypothetical protein
MTKIAISAMVLLVGFGGELSSGTVEAANAAAPQAPAGLLHDRAIRAGGQLVEVLADEGHSPCATIAELAARAPVIVIGKSLGHRMHLAPDGGSITTDTVIKVQEAVKGGVVPGALITVSVRGGSHRFADGATARQVRRGYRPMRDGAHYLLFLHESPARVISRGAVVYEFVLGPQGQVELDFDNDTAVPAAGEPSHPLAARYSKASVRQILSELHAGVPRR